VIAARKRHHHRRDGEMHDVLETEDQRHRHRGRFAKGQNGDARPHIADIAIGARKPLDRRVADQCAANEDACGKHQREHRIGDHHAGEHIVPARQLFDRRSRQEFEKQGRQRHIDDEGVEPAHRLLGLPGDPRGDVAKQDQPKNGSTKPVISAMLDAHCLRSCHTLPKRLKGAMFVRRCAVKAKQLNFCPWQPI
jgi:hypothetical protein